MGSPTHPANRVAVLVGMQNAATLQDYAVGDCRPMIEKWANYLTHLTPENYRAVLYVLLSDDDQFAEGSPGWYPTLNRQLVHKGIYTFETRITGFNMNWDTENYVVRIWDGNPRKIETGALPLMRWFDIYGSLGMTMEVCGVNYYEAVYRACTCLTWKIGRRTVALRDLIFGDPPDVNHPLFHPQPFSLR